MAIVVNTVMVLIPFVEWNGFGKCELLLSGFESFPFYPADPNYFNYLNYLNYLNYFDYFAYFAYSVYSAIGRLCKCRRSASGFGIRYLNI